MTRLSAFSSPFVLGFDDLERLLERATKAGDDGYPPYNIELTGEDQYQITMAVAGFSEDELDIEVKQNTLRVAGRKSGDQDKDHKYLYRGIASRGFERRFQLADYVRVDGAILRNGLLHVDLVREIPEAMKPRRIEIGAGGDKPAIESSAEAA